VALFTSVPIARRALECTVALVPVDEPSDARAWPRLDGLGGYRVVDLAPIHDTSCLYSTSPRPMPMGKPRLVTDGVCPERGLPVEAWFDRWDSYRRSAEELAIAKSPTNDVLAVFGQMDRTTRPADNEHFVAAFRRVRDSGPYHTLRAVWMPILAAVALGASVTRLRRRN
jgi:hypothetical protein